jgi:hypothetical protein
MLCQRQYFVSLQDGGGGFFLAALLQQAYGTAWRLHFSLLDMRKYVLTIKALRMWLVDGGSGRERRGRVIDHFIPFVMLLCCC